MKALLDSTAWLAHLFGEPGVGEVTELFEQAEVFLCCLSIPEVYGRLKAAGAQARWPEVWSAYLPLFERVLEVDEPVAHRAIELRQASTRRIPTVDSLIAATASLHGLTLVHRDPHLAAVPASLLASLVLPDHLMGR